MTDNHRNETGFPSSEESPDQPHVIGVHGAIQQRAIAAQALSEALRAVTNAEATTEFLDLAELELPLYNPDRPEPEDAVAFTQKISRADAVVVATSVRHGSFPALLKTALDYCDPEDIDNKPVGLVAVAEGSGPAFALDHLRTVFKTLNARVLPIQVSINATWKTNELPEGSVNALWKLGQEIVDER